MAWGGRRQEVERVRDLNERSFDRAAMAFLDLDRSATLWRSGVEAFEHLQGARISQGGQWSHAVDSVQRTVDEAVSDYLLLSEEIERQRVAERPSDLNLRAKGCFDRLSAAQQTLDQFDTQFPQVTQQLAKAADARRTFNQAVGEAEAVVAQWTAELARAQLHSNTLTRWAAELQALRVQPGADPMPGAVERAQEIARQATRHGAELVRVAGTADQVRASLQTRLEALSGRAGMLAGTVSVLRREYPANCSADLDPYPDLAGAGLLEAADALARVGAPGGDADRWAAGPQQVRTMLAEVEQYVVAVEDRRSLLETALAAGEDLTEKLRFRLKDTQTLAVRSGPEMVRAEGPALDALLPRIAALQVMLPLTRQRVWEFHQESVAISAALDQAVARIRQQISGRRHP